MGKTVPLGWMNGVEDPMEKACGPQEMGQNSHLDEVVG